MKKYLYNIAMISLLGFLIGCGKENGTEPEESDPYDDIWQTDTDGNTIKPDSTDWVNGDAGSFQVSWGNPHSPPYPNPADSAIKIGYAITTHCYVNMWITSKNDTSTARLLTKGMQQVGVKAVLWDLADSTGNRLANGLYTCHLTVEDSLNKYEGKGEILIVE